MCVCYLKQGIEKKIGSYPYLGLDFNFSRGLNQNP